MDTNDTLQLDLKLDSLDELREAIEFSEIPEKYVNLKTYLLKLISLAETQTINRQTACYYMAQLIPDPDFEVDSNERISNVLWHAFELELPYVNATEEATKQAYDTSWVKLMEEIKNL